MAVFFDDILRVSGILLLLLTIIIISLDRYFAICQPFRYHETVSVRLVWKLNAGVWLFSAFVGFVPIHAGWNTVDGSVQNWSASDKCVFQLNVVYALVIAVGTYFLPLAVMCTVYFKILRVSRKQVTPSRNNDNNNNNNNNNSICTAPFSFAELRGRCRITFLRHICIIACVNDSEMAYFVSGGITHVACATADDGAFLAVVLL